jgi:hypothetical protein
MAQKNDLFIEHLENVGHEVFAKYADVITRFIHGRNGIYALYRGDDLYYVGLASDLRRRLKQHRDDRHAEKWDRFSVYLTRNERFLKELETFLLRISLPEGNHVRGKFRGSKDLKQQLQASIKDVQKRELHGLMGKAEKVKGSVVKTTRNTNRAVVLRREYKGRVYLASWRKDGSVLYAKKVYASLSAAGRAVTKRSTNGWSFWMARNADREWVRLDLLKK